MAKNKNLISIVIPAYNEEKRVSKTLNKYIQYYDKEYLGKYEILVIANACKDKTVEILEKFKTKYPNIVDYKHYSGKIGKGGALAKGLKKAKGKYVSFVDADLSIRPKMLDRLFQIMQLIPTIDCAIGSRNIPGSVVKGRKPSRKLMTRGFNLGVNFLFRLGIKDTQCGAKVIRKEILEKVIPNLSISNMAFDVNFLVDTKKAGGQILEVPVEWTDDLDSTITKPIKTSVVMALSVLRLRLVYSRFKFLYWWILHPISELLWLILLTKDERENRIIQKQK